MDFDSLDDSEDEFFDDFLFDSIQRYNTLQMFNLENTPHHLFQLNPTVLCVACKRKKGDNSELLKLQLPPKLSLPAQQRGRSKENDFKILSALYTKNLVCQIGRLEIEEKIITSENDVSGLQIYKFSDSALGNQSQVLKLDVTPWPAPDFAAIQGSTNVICSKCSCEPLIHIDISVGEKVKEIKHPFSTPCISSENWHSKPDLCSLNNIKCKPLSTDTIAVLNSYSGDIVLHDVRTNDNFESLPGCNDTSSKERWTISDFDYSESSINYFGILSNRKSICIYDKRKNSILIQKIRTDAPNESYSYMKMKFNNCGNKFSISGLDSNIHINRLNENDFEPVFTHIGHCPSNLSSAIVTSHVWLQAGGNEYVVSICDNNTLHCWDYKN